MWKRSVWVLAIAVVIALTGRTLLSYLSSNAGFLMLSQKKVSNVSPIMSPMLDSFAQAIRFDRSNTAGYRGLGFANLALQKYAAAHRAFLNGGVKQEEMIFFADRANRENQLALASDWLLLAEMGSAGEPALWQVAGKVCQKDPQIDELCDRFLEKNGQNRLVNSRFDFAKDGWYTKHSASPGAHYDVVACPDGMTGLCAYMHLTDDKLEQSLSWSQCVKLEAGQRYMFSAWIKVDVADTSVWRPVYVQGAIDGAAKGLWPGDRNGSSPWTYWQQEITMPEFDNNQACLYPALLMSNGQVWFSQPSLTLSSD